MDVPLKFNHVFFILLTLSAMSAFLIPAQYSDRVHPQLQAVFAPVAMPVRTIARWASEKASPPRVADARGAVLVSHENQELKQANAKLLHDLEEMRRINADREKVGSIRELCTPVAVDGNPDSSRETLALRGSSLQGLRDGQFVLYDNDIVGTLRAGKLGAQVRLITDPGFRVNCYFRSQRRNEKGEILFARIDLPDKLVEGVGRGVMVCRGLPYDDVKKSGLAVGDWAVLNDSDWPARLKGRRLGQVTSVGRWREHPLFAEIKIQPVSNLMRLSEVMVLTKNQ
jgi:hypothetical protein